METLKAAILAGDPELVRAALSAGAKVNVVLADGRTALNTAIGLGDLAVISLLLEAGANIHGRDSFRVDCARLQPIHYACRNNKQELVRDLIAKGVHVDVPDEGNCTPLHHAVYKGHYDLSVYLVESGADIHWASHSGRTPLWKAAESGHRELVRYLHDQGASLDTPNKVAETVLFQAVSLDHLLPTAQDLVRLGINVNSRDIEGSTALHKASSLGNVQAVELLLDSGQADSTIRNEHGNTALHNASIHGHPKCVASLLIRGSLKTLEALNNSGHSSLYLAMAHCQMDAVKLLHDFGARLTPTEHRTFLRQECSRNQPKDEFWEWCSRYFSQPKDLSVLCSYVIRQSLKEPVIKSCPKLPLPTFLQLDVLSQ